MIPCPLCECQVTCPHSDAEREAVWVFYETGSIEYMLDDGPLPPDWHAELINHRERAKRLPDVNAILGAYYARQ